VCHFEFIIDNEESNPKKKKEYRRSMTTDMTVLFFKWAMVVVVFIVYLILIDWANILISSRIKGFAYVLGAIFMIALILYVADVERFRLIPAPIINPVWQFLSIVLAVGVNLYKLISIEYYKCRFQHRSRIWQAGDVPLVVDLDDDDRRH